MTGNVTAAARVTRSAGKYRAHVSFTSVAGAGARTLDNASCEILADSVALVIALGAMSSSRSTNAQATNGSVGIAVSAHATALLGALPKPALGVGGALALEGLWALRFELSGTYYAHQSTTFIQSSLGAEFALLRLGVRGCRPWRLGALELAPCLGAELYRIDGAGFGGEQQDSGAAYAWGPMLGAFGRLRLLTWLALTLSADGVVPVARHVFEYPDRGILHRPAVVFWQMFLAPEVQF